MNAISPREQFSSSLSRSGFTLVEMLLVLVILSILGAIIYPNLSGQGLRARIMATQLQIKTFQASLSSFEMDNDHFPQGHDRFARAGAAPARRQKLARTLL